MSLDRKVSPELVAQFIKSNIETIVVAKPLDWQTVEDPVALKNCIAHCVINGPVGVGKENAFPWLFEGSIRTKFGCRSSQWRETCRQVALLIEHDDVLRGRSLSCRMYGNFWPLAGKDV